MDSGRFETYQFPERLDVDVLGTSPSDVMGFIAPFWADTRSSNTFFKVRCSMLRDITKLMNVTVRQDFFICWITLPADLKIWDSKKKKNQFCPSLLQNCLFLVSSEITLKIIILKHHSGLVNHVKIMINRVHVFFFLPLPMQSPSVNTALHVFLSDLKLYLNVVNQCFFSIIKFLSLTF